MTSADSQQHNSLSSPELQQAPATVAKIPAKKRERPSRSKEPKGSPAANAMLALAFGMDGTGTGSVSASVSDESDSSEANGQNLAEVLPLRIMDADNGVSRKAMEAADRIIRHEQAKKLVSTVQTYVSEHKDGKTVSIARITDGIKDLYQDAPRALKNDVIRDIVGAKICTAKELRTALRDERAGAGTALGDTQRLVDEFETCLSSLSRSEVVGTVIGLLEQSFKDNPDEVDSCYRALTEANICTRREWKEAVKTWRRAQKEEDDSESELMHYEDFVRDYLGRMKLTIRLSGEVVSTAPTDADRVNLSGRKNYDTLFKKMYVYALNNGLNYKKTGLQYAFDFVLEEIKDRLREEMWERIKFDPSTVESAKAVWQELGVLFGFDEGEEWLPASVLQKFIHSTKRKMSNQEVGHHLATILVGVQGAGKSEFLIRLLSPVADEVVPTNFKQICDVRNSQLWDHAVLKIDELEGASSADIGALNNRVTAPEISYRPMGTNKTVPIRNRSTFIGSSNRSIAELLNDNTGMRRFVELNYRVGRGDPGAFELVNRIDFGLLWKSVDENGPDPIEPWLPVLAAKQEELRVPEEVEEWLSDEDRDAHRTGRGRATPLPAQWDELKQVKLLYEDHYVPWVRAKNRNPAHQFKAFALVMKRLYDQRGAALGLTRKENGKKPVLYFLSASASPTSPDADASAILDASAIDDAA